MTSLGGPDTNGLLHVRQGPVVILFEKIRRPPAMIGGGERRFDAERGVEVLKGPIRFALFKPEVSTADKMLVKFGLRRRASFKSGRARSWSFC